MNITKVVLTIGFSISFFVNSARADTMFFLHTLFYTADGKPLTEKDHKIVYDLLMKELYDYSDGFDLRTNFYINDRSSDELYDYPKKFDIQKELDKKSAYIRVLSMDENIFSALSIELASNIKDTIFFKYWQIMGTIDGLLLEDILLENLQQESGITEKEFTKSYFDTPQARSTHLDINNTIVRALFATPINNYSEFVANLHRTIDTLCTLQTLKTMALKTMGNNSDISSLLKEMHDIIDNGFGGYEQECKDQLVSK